MQSITLQEIIRNHVHLGRANPDGWQPILCKVCSDHGRKGPRAAFKFDGDTVGYHCFNCNHSTVYDPNVHRSMPRKMLEVLEAFGISDSEWRVVIFNNLARTQTAYIAQQAQHLSIEPEAIPLPAHFVPLNECKEDDVTLYAKEYLQGRGVDWKNYPFFVSQHRRWFGRLIIPVYKDNKLIYYQGRDLSGIAKQKYISPTKDRARILYGYENLHANIDEPLYVTEGWFDAYIMTGVAVFGNHLYDPQIKWLNQSQRQKVIIPDRFGDGKDLAFQAIDLGWSVSTPDAPGCKDVSDIIEKYGMLYTLKTVHDNTAAGFAAKTNVSLYCKKGP